MQGGNIMWDGKKKAVTFSYDDGVVYDRRLVGIFNKYGLKCTFNLNSGIMTGASHWNDSGVEIHRMNAAGLPELYKGHEIAVHCLTHAVLTDCDDETLYNEVMLDKENLERMFGCRIEGMAYPYGAYNEHVAEMLGKCGFRYARTVCSTDKAAAPSNLLTYFPTAHHSSEKLPAIIDEFLNSDSEEPQLLYIWGHSYEFEVNKNWDYIEKLCSTVAGRDDIFYGTNSEVLSPFYGK